MTSSAPGSARLVLADNVVHLDPAPAVFEAMLEGWRRQQSARFLKNSVTIAPRLRLIRRMERFTGLYPWQWTPADGEAFIDHLRGGESPIVVSTARTYEVTIGLFLEFLLDSRYGWVARNTAMIEAVTELPPIVVSDLFGLHPGTAHSWAKLAQGNWIDYLAACQPREPK